MVCEAWLSLTKMCGVQWLIEIRLEVLPMKVRMIPPMRLQAATRTHLHSILGEERSLLAGQKFTLTGVGRFRVARRPIARYLPPLPEDMMHDIIGT